MLKLVPRGARTKTAKVWRAPYVKGPPMPHTRTQNVTLPDTHRFVRGQPGVDPHPSVQRLVRHGPRLGALEVGGDGELPKRGESTKIQSVGYPGQADVRELVAIKEQQLQGPQLSDGRRGQERGHALIPHAIVGEVQVPAAHGWGDCSRRNAARRQFKRNGPA